MSLTKFLPVLLIFMTTIACGSRGPLTRDYNYQIIASDPEIKNFVIKALEEYNKQAGMDMVGYTDSSSRSTISIKEGEVLRNCKRGLSQAECNKTDPKIGLARYGINDDVTYGEIQFDYDYLKKRADLSQGLNKEGFILVTHEQGHVLGLDHVDNPTDIMDEFINNANKDIPVHFQKAVHSYNQDYPTNVI